LTKVRELLRPVLDDEALTRGLGDEEARILVDWLADRAERLARSKKKPAEAADALAPLFRRARAVSRFVWLWSYRDLPGAAIQLAGAERVTWPLPLPDTEPIQIMQHIIEFEEQACRSDRVKTAD